MSFIKKLFTRTPTPVSKPETPKPSIFDLTPMLAGKQRRQTSKLVIHCADTYDYMDIGAEEIHQWHLERGWSGIGYHFVIRRDGTIEAGRHYESRGAHVRGHNKDSIAICMVGGKGLKGEPKDNFTHAQFNSLREVVFAINEKYPGVKTFGHRDLQPAKNCPCFDWRVYL